ncbi:hypothetical protein [Legionella saoudiensis]|uniref:hypothetical protein n=1 Tax=Legionella saoudiensis TaxID=1750561 RepID=UPI00072FB02D|nr:hypothetical protein [Legionella saoudiensis]
MAASDKYRITLFQTSGVTSANGLASVSAMVPMTPEDAHRIVVNPVYTAKTQTEKAAHVRSDFEPNQKAAEVLNKCYNRVNAVVNNNYAVEEKVTAERDFSPEMNEDDAVVSTPSFRR